MKASSDTEDEANDIDVEFDEAEISFSAFFI
jgi:hypothetical protein